MILSNLTVRRYLATISSANIKTISTIPWFTARATSTMSSVNIKTAANDFLSFVDASPTPYHAVKSVKERLSKAGFKEIKEREPWSSTCTPGGKYYMTRNGSTIIAFAIGKNWKPGNPIAMAASHVDSPCLKIKPISKREADGYLQVGVETYGGGLWHTWLDRDLGIAGRVMVRESEEKIVPKLVHIKKPILRIPNLAIHLDRQETLTINKETQLVPIAGLISAELKRQGLTKKEKEDGAEEEDGDFNALKAITLRHHSPLLELIAADAGVESEKIVDLEIVLYDTQNACLGGLTDEFIYSARLDNLNQTYCIVTGFIDSLQKSSALDDETGIRLCACFDHEEVGSMSAQGAFGSLLPFVARRLSVLPSSDSESDSSYDKTNDVDISTAYEQSMSASFLLSADMAHAIHPNYAIKYEANHKCEMNKGPVIKVNSNTRYATNAPGIVILQEVARRAPKLLDTDEVGVPLQLFVVRNDSPCGSTIGPMLSAHMALRTLDLGNAQLAMHSCREIAGTDDVHHAIRLFASFYEHYSKLEKSIVVD